MSDAENLAAYKARIEALEKRLGIKTKEQLERESKGPDRGKLTPRNYQRRRHP